MDRIIDDILEMLSEDMVSHGFLTQCVVGATNDGSDSHARVKNVLEELLLSGSVELGETKLAAPKYVEFVAWTGSIAERVNRAMDAVAAAKGANKEFAYWLCLRKNVDRFEP